MSVEFGITNVQEILPLSHVGSQTLTNQSTPSSGLALRCNVARAGTGARTVRIYMDHPNEIIWIRNGNESQRFCTLKICAFHR